MKRYTILTITLAMICFFKLSGQDNLEDMLNSEVGEATDYATATFKATRIINGHSIERMPQGQLDFRIHHRFGPVNQGKYNFWGIDGATTHFSLEYGITNWWMVGAGRGTFEKTFDGFSKFSLFRQSTGKVNMPVSISYYTSIAIRTQDFPNVDSVKKNDNYPFSGRLSYVNQLLVARKFNSTFSLQLSPTHIHYNLTPTEIDSHDIFAMGIGGRMKVSNRISLNAEYFYTLRPSKDYMSQTYYNAFSVGVDIETGGHVFQLLLTNSYGMIEKEFIGRNVDKWGKGGIHFGFNISRVFDINHKTN